MRVSPTRGVQHFGIKGKLAPRYIGPFEIIETLDPLLTDFVFLLSWPPFIMYSMYHNSGSASKYLLRSLNHKILRLNPIYPIRSIQSKFLTPRKEVREGRKLKCTRSSGSIIPKKKPLGRLKISSKETFPTFLEPICNTPGV